MYVIICKIIIAQVEIVNDPVVAIARVIDRNCVTGMEIVLLPPVVNPASANRRRYLCAASVGETRKEVFNPASENDVRSIQI